MTELKPLGPELILDIHDCDPSTYTKEAIKKFVVELCEVIDMVRTELHIWEYFEDPEQEPEQMEHLAGLSVIQFIKTSNITIHTFDSSNRVTINLFSCKDFNPDTARDFCVNFFKGRAVQCVVLQRK